MPCVCRRSEQTLFKELEFAVKAVYKAPHNESPWNYIRGLLQVSGSKVRIGHCEQLHRMCQVHPVEIILLLLISTLTVIFWAGFEPFCISVCVKCRQDCSCN